jgi:adhesin transport system outer membrane protein
MTKKANYRKDSRTRAIGPVGLGAALIGTALLFGAAGTANAGSLEDAVRTAVDTNPDIGVVAKDRRAIDHELRQAKALYLPSVDTRVAVGPEWTKSVAGAVTSARTGRLDRQEYSITLTQLLFDGFNAASEVQKQKSRVKSAALRVADTSESIGLDAVQAYLDVVRQQELLALAQENQATHERTLEDMKQRLRGGTGSMADVRQAEARLARAIASVAETRGHLEDSKANYIRAVGQAPEGLTRPAGVAASLPPNVDMAVAQGLEQNYKILTADADVGVAKADLRQSAADFYPKIDAELSAVLDRNIAGVRGSSRADQALIVMKWNLFRGGETMAKNEEFVERLAEAKEAVNQQKIRVEQDTRLSWSALQTARDRREALALQVKANEKVRDAYIQQFNLGQRSLLDVLDIQNELFISRGDLITAEFVELFAGYRLLAAQGRLLNTLGVNHRPESNPAMVSTMAEEPKMAEAVPEAAPEAVPAEGATATDGQAPAAAPEGQAGDETATPAAPAADTAEGAGEPAPAATEAAPAAEAAPSAEAAPAAPVESAQAPTEGFKDAAAENVSDQSLMSLSFNPMWSVQ